ncbi:hypothetical protein CONPUDRAFT_53455 [Coniophora puteana RWD-64-598 SS2]|uniref:Uncharacterized protein n=1 Tax=Coniophora puteana (strain RWD-64-598) TaxID=741705 RepID=A0A5M3MRA9_CONPW|nr:uncharacterized protein CONPUDRAFT_53455 [Coniophora puteana RWD-64-598 SS2]EIW81712.1 hypothetical protein CONPUDRAFT_53455 [Coniophora puteana RWD-64-598 SS2]
MSLDPAWAPANQTSFDLWVERSSLDGVMLGGVAYGVHLTLFSLCFNMILSIKNKAMVDWLNLGYICLVFALGTLGNALTLKWCEMAFVDNINFPGRPVAFSLLENTDWVYVVFNAVYIVNLWLSDGLLVRICSFAHSIPRAVHC